ncbi:MAG: type VI secretion system tube protein Hcp [Deltaproteobacteria bacterium]|nr:type VI secretion system tube protein Hcp [Deltaproteobacteria bacterium]
MAEPVYLFVEGTKQGKFECDFTKDHKVVKNGIPILTFATEVEAPRDIATGQASGRRQHKPVFFTKQVDATSAQFWQALTTNEALKKVEFQFYRIQKTGQMELYFKITLEKATLASMKMIQATEHEGGEGAKTSAGVGIYAARDEIALAYEKITWEHMIAKKVAEDDWVNRL